MKFKVGDKVKIKYIPGTQDWYSPVELFENYPDLCGVHTLVATTSAGWFNVEGDQYRFNFNADSLELVESAETPAIDASAQISVLITKAHTLSQELDAIYKQIFALMKEGDIENESW
jgi:purine nucleoside phosphorylase